MRVDFFQFIQIVGSLYTRLFMVAIVAIGMAIMTVTTLAAPPNDGIATAQILPGGSGQITGTNVGSTKEAGEPVHALNKGGTSVWYKLVSPGNGVYTIDTIGTTFDTLLAVYKGTGLNDLKLIGANDNFVGGAASRITFGLASGDTYYIAVDGKDKGDGAGAVSGPITLHYAVSNVVGNDNFANATPLNQPTDKMITTTNVGASIEVGEPYASGKSVWYKWTAPAAAANKTYNFTVGGRALNGDPIFRKSCEIYTGTALNNLQAVSFGGGPGVGRCKLAVTAGTTYYIQLDGIDAGQGTATGTFTMDYGPAKSRKESDFDHDGKADLTIFRPLTGTWYTLNSITDDVRVFQFGTNGDKPVLTDVGSDGELDYTVFRPDTAIWYVNDTEKGFRAYQYGSSTDTPFVFVDNVEAQTAVYRPTNGVWYHYSAQYNSGSQVPFGTSGDIPVPAQYNGYYDDSAVFRPSNGTWYNREDNYNFTSVKFGLNGDKPVPADYDGDGLADRAVFRPSNGTWYVMRSSDGSVMTIAFGLSGDKAQPADYDGDGKVDIAVFRPSTGDWWILQSADGSVRSVHFGANGDIPVASPVG